MNTLRTLSNCVTCLESLFILHVLLTCSESVSSTINENDGYTLKIFGEKSTAQLNLLKENANESEYLKAIHEKREVSIRNRRSADHNISKEGDTLTCESDHSCCKKCEEKAKDWRGCQCDSYCTFFTDCCADYQRYHGNKTAKNPTHLKFEQLSCTNEFSKKEHYIWLVNRCPDSQRGKKLSVKCENANNEEPWSGTDEREFIPVHGGNSLVYRNEYCARCNGEHKIQHFQVEIKCGILPPSSATTMNEKIQFALKYCGNASIRCQAVREDYQPRTCLPNLTISCPSTNHYHEQCVRGPVGIVTVKQKHYRNIWCAKCFEEHHAQETCGPADSETNNKPVIPKIVPISLALDITNYGFSTRVITSCRKSSYDSKLEICLKSLSWPTVVKVPKKKSIDKYVVVIWFTSKNTRSSISKKNIYSSLRKTFNINISQMDKLYFRKRRPNHLASFRLWLTSEQTLRLAKQRNETMNNQVKTYQTRAMRKTLPLKRLLFFSKEFNMTIRKQIFTVFKTTSRELTCINKQTYSSKEYTLLPNGDFYINSSGKTYEKRQVFLEGSRVSTKKNISVCAQVVLSKCRGNLTSLNETEFSRFENLTIFSNRTKRTHKFGEYDIQNDKMMVCTLPRVLINLPDHSNTQVHLTYLTLIGFSLSLFSLFVVILTYAIFSELRSVPGKNVLNLSVSLFLGQLIWLTAVGQTGVPVLCHVIAMVEHYLLLVSFVAMTVIAYQTYWTFSSKDVSKNDEDENKKFFKYCTIIWCIPAIFVGTCVVLDKKAIYTIYPKNTNLQICWFENKEAQKYLFVLPVGVTILFNTIFFILTVVHLQMKRSETDRISSSHTRLAQNMSWIYLKIATLLGFSWVFGLLDLLVHSTIVFSYLFVIFASLQGVHIAVAFIMNKRVFKKYKRLMRRKISKRYNQAGQDGVGLTNNSRDRSMTNCK